MKQAPMNPAFAAALSFIFPGLGQVYVGKAGLGIIYALACVVSVFLMIVLIGLITYPILWLLSIYTAYTGAQQHNDRIRDE